MGISCHLGSGRDIKAGWVNIDILPIHNVDNYIQWDLSSGLPPLDDIDYIYSSHFLEHLVHWDALALLRDCKNKMNKGGIIKLCLPDFRKMAAAYVNNDWEFFNHPDVLPFCPNRILCEVANYAAYQRQADGVAEHKTLYDQEYAEFTLSAAGFSIIETQFDPNLDCENRRRFSLYAAGVA